MAGICTHPIRKEVVAGRWKKDTQEGEEAGTQQNHPAEGVVAQKAFHCTMYTPPGGTIHIQPISLTQCRPIRE